MSPALHCKYSRNVKDEFCALCGEADSKEHRVFHCPHLSDLRDQHSSLFAQLPQCSQAFWNFGICSSEWAGWLLKMDLPSDLPEVVLPDHGGSVNVFTDGSAFLQDCPQFTIAAGAAISVVGADYHVVDAQIWPGADHSSYRGEVWAISLALQRVWAPRFFTDCSAVWFRCSSRC